LYKNWGFEGWKGGPEVVGRGMGVRGWWGVGWWKVRGECGGTVEEGWKMEVKKSEAREGN